MALLALEAAEPSIDIRSRMHSRKLAQCIGRPFGLMIEFIGDRAVQNHDFARALQSLDSVILTDRLRELAMDKIGVPETQVRATVARILLGDILPKLEITAPNAAPLKGQQRRSE